MHTELAVTTDVLSVAVLERTPATLIKPDWLLLIIPDWKVTTVQTTVSVPVTPVLRVAVTVVAFVKTAKARVEFPETAPDALYVVPPQNITEFAAKILDIVAVPEVAEAAMVILTC